MVERAGNYGRQSLGKAKSIADQMSVGREVCEEHGWLLAEEYEDGISASRYAKKKRDDWPKVLDDIANRRIDILILWESSRGDRTLTTWSAMLDLCIEKGVKIYIVSNERLYDPRNHRDWKTLAEDGVNSAAESNVISLRATRGHRDSAKRGRPVGKVLFGYRRVYDPTTGELVNQVPDENADTARFIIAQVAKGVPVSAIAKDLNARGVRPPGKAAQWVRQRVREIALNEHYAGTRKHREARYDGIWDGLVDEKLSLAARRVLTDPARTTTRPGRQKHLLSYLALSPCGAPMSAGGTQYRCSANGCVTVKREPVDRFVEDQILDRLRSPDALATLRRAGDDSSDRAAMAATEAAMLRERLDGWRLSAARGETSPESLAVIEKGMKEQIAELEAQVNPAGAALPQALMDLLEPAADIAARWRAMPVPAQRTVIGALAVIVVGPAETFGPGSFDPWRLERSRWVGDARTWGEIWAA